MAEQLYLAVETRCDINQTQISAPSETEKNALLEMENEQAKQWLRQSTVSISHEVCVASVSKGGAKRGYARGRSEGGLLLRPS